MKAAGRQAPGSGAVRLSPALAAGRSVPWWGALSAAAALGFLVGGCTVATALQPSSFNWLASTVSALTVRGVADPWVMTAAFAVTGACEMATALALRPAAMPGRLILAAGTFGAMGTAVSSIRRRRRNAPRPARLVPHGADHQRRNDRPG
jgi:hypothetical protein